MLCEILQQVLEQKKKKNWGKADKNPNKSYRLVNDIVPRFILSFPHHIIVMQYVNVRGCLGTVRWEMSVLFLELFYSSKIILNKKV